MKQTDFSSVLILSLIGALFVIWLSLIIAPFIDEGLFEILDNLSKASFTNITWCDNSLKTVFILLIVYIFSLVVYFTTKKNYRKGEEYGSAKMGNATAINKKYKQSPPENNKILTNKVMIGLDGRKHLRNISSISLCRK